MHIILLTPESVSKDTHIPHPAPGSYVISKEVETYRAHFSGTIEAIIADTEWHDIMRIPYTEVSTTLQTTLEKLAEKIRMRSASHLSNEKLAA